MRRSFCQPLLLLCRKRQCYRHSRAYSNTVPRKEVQRESPQYVSSTQAKDESYSSNLDDGSPLSSSSESSNDNLNEAIEENRIHSESNHENVKEKKNVIERTGEAFYRVFLDRTYEEEPTLQDLLAIKPRKRPANDSPQYSEAYMEFHTRLCRTFRKEQLRQFAVQLGVDELWTRRGRRKTEYAETLMEKHFGWDNLRELERRRRDMTEMNVKTFPVSAAELFLLLGKDGTRLHQISTDYSVRVTVTPDPLLLRIEGLRGALKHLEALIAKRRKAIVERTIQVPGDKPLRSDILRNISRVSDAYLENLGRRGKIRICANNIQCLDHGERLALRAAVQEYQMSFTPFFALLPSQSSSLSSFQNEQPFALFPFTPLRSLSWTIKTRATFRSRRVNDWLGDDRKNNVALLSLAGGNEDLLDEKGAKTSLQSIIDNELFDPSESLVVSASTGHILFSDKNQEQRTSLLSPLPTQSNYLEFMNWLNAGNAHRTFAPSPPIPKLNIQTSEGNLFHRLIYKSIPNTSENIETAKPQLNSVMKFIALDIPIHNSKRIQPLFDTATKTAERKHVDSVDSDKVEGTSIESEEHLQSTPESSDNSLVMDECSIGEPVCRIGKELNLLVAMPDRSIDIKFLAATSSSMSISALPEVEKYYQFLAAYLEGRSDSQPEAPALFSQGGKETFVLETNAIVRKSIEHTDVPLSPSLSIPDFNNQATDEHSVTTITENVTDLDTNQKFVNCEVFCNSSNLSDWEKFLGKLDKFTTLDDGLPGKSQRTSFDLDEDKHDELVSYPLNY